MAVIAKNESHLVGVEEAADQGPLGTAVGLFTGSLLSFLAESSGAEVVQPKRTPIPDDLAKVGVDESFLVEVERRLRPGTWAVVAEVWEDWTVPVDLRIAVAGGTLLRQARGEVLDAQIERDVTALGAELAALKVGQAHARKEGKAKLGAMIDEARTKLRAAQDRAKAALELAAKESEAKVRSLQDKLSNARADTITKLEARIAETQYDYRRRSEKLHRAWELAKQALVA